MLCFAFSAPHRTIHRTNLKKAVPTWLYEGADCNSDMCFYELRGIRRVCYYQYVTYSNPG
uniref:Uncharacterized protein n=1 Tax=Anopheles minimus TaxID=112268 RepID=A0A182WNL0_9DIPT